MRNDLMGFIEKWFNRLISPLVIAMYVVLVLCLFLQILTRYVFKYPLIWTEEMGIYMFIWVLFLSAGLAFVPDSHIRVTFLFDRLPAGIKRVMEVIIRVAILACLTLIIRYGFHFSMLMKTQMTPALRISKMIPTLAVPVGSLVMLLGVIHSILKLFEQDR